VVPSGPPTSRDLKLVGLVLAAVLIVTATSFAALFVPSPNVSHDAPDRAHVQYLAHDPIMIYFDSDFTSENGVNGGSGTAGDPYIISGWDISTETIGGCIFLWRTTAHYVIRDCHVHTPNAVCIEVQEAPNGTIENCVVDLGDYGIYVTKSSRTNVTGNTVANMETAGIIVGSSSWVNVTGNVATNDNMGAIMLSRVYNTTLADNTASGNNGTGILVGNATNLLITGNNASGNGVCGLQIDDVRNLEVRENNITSNLGCGLLLSNATVSSIFHNRFVGNGAQAHQENSSSVAWDDGYPSGGNYWSDYAGADAFSGPDQDVPGSDSIGDTPYQISTGESDRYPHMSESFLPVPELAGIVVPLVFLLASIVIIVRRRRVR
jgi:parallel beta-helix repeat protein